MSAEYRWLANISRLQKTSPPEDGRFTPGGHSDPTGNIVASMERVRHQVKVFDKEFRRVLRKFMRDVEGPYGHLREAYHLVDRTYERTDNVLRPGGVSKAEVGKARTAKQRRTERGEGFGVA